MKISTPTDIIIPCFNEGARIGPLLREFGELLQDEPNVRVTVVDDGSRLDQLQVVQQLVDGVARTCPRITLLKKSQNGGKGSAIAYGVANTVSPIFGFLDADGSVSAAECLNVLRMLEQRPELVGVIGSRVKMLGKVVERRLSRHLIGRVFATLVSLLFNIPVYDSQCGCKFFRRAPVLPLLSGITSQTWLWDTQLLLLAYLEQMPVEECPVSWREIPGSKVSMLKDPIKMFWQLLAFKKTLVR